VRWIKKLVFWLLRCFCREKPRHNSSEISLAALRVAAHELIDGFASYAEQCWETGQGEQVRTVQLLAEWVGKELQKAVGFPPTLN